MKAKTIAPRRYYGGPLYSPRRLKLQRVHAVEEDKRPPPSEPPPGGKKEKSKLDTVLEARKPCMPRCAHASTRTHAQELKKAGMDASKAKELKRAWDKAGVKDPEQVCQQ